MDGLNCNNCKGELWVCEDHRDQPWDNWHQENCGPGMMCKCHPSHLDNMKFKLDGGLSAGDIYIDGYGKKRVLKAGK